MYLYIKFDLNQAKLHEAYTPQLDKVVAYLQSDASVRAIIEGHTCNLGPAAYNLSLSVRRAAAVKDYLVTTGRIPEERLEIKGVGEALPISDNSTEAGRKKNRCVVIHYY